MLVCLGSFVVAGATPVPAARLRLGDKPPELALDSYLPARQPSWRRWADLEGHVVMLEFWTTWCPGCVAALPKLNELSRELRDDPFTLIVVNNEEPEHVREFLETHELDVLLGFDHDNRTTTEFGIGCYPVAVLIDTQGRIAAITDPANISARNIRTLIHGDPVRLPLIDTVSGKPIAENTASGTEERTDGQPSLGITIEPNPDENRPMMLPPDHGVLSADAYSRRLLIATAYDVDQWLQLDYRLPESATVYRVDLHGLEGEAGRTVLRAVLPTMFGFEARWEERELDVFLLQRPPGASDKGPVPSEAVRSTGMATPASLDLKGASLKKVARLLSNMALDALVIDETGLGGKYDLQASWSPGDFASIRSALRSHGLDLVPDRRKVPILIVEPAQ